MSEANVFIGGIKCGSLVQTGMNINFVYDEKWQVNGYAISNSLPLNGEYTKDVAHSFFSNLLPEGNIRDLVCKKLKITPDNDWELLMAIGKESAGALTILKPNENYKEITDYKILSNEQLNKLSVSKSVMPQVITDEASRLSLAGAQDKIAAYFDGQDYWLPLNGAPTNRILKFENDDYKQLTVNEVFLNHLAKKIGLEVSKSILYVESKKPIAIFERYDRIKEDNRLKRIHQEDLCQAFGISQKIKYEKEGGPKLTDALKLVQETSNASIKNRESIIQWQIFNILCGNSDGHGKNISIFRNENQVFLTPFYDLACTRVYKALDRNLAMSFGGTFDPDLLDNTRINLWRKELGVTYKYLNDELVRIIKLIEKFLPEVEEEFIKLYGKFGIIEQIRLFILKKIKKTLNSI